MHCSILGIFEKVVVCICCCMFDGCLRVFTNLKNAKTLRKVLEVIVDEFSFLKNVRNEFGGCFIDIGLGNVAVAAARVMGGTSALQ